MYYRFLILVVIFITSCSKYSKSLKKDISSCTTVNQNTSDIKSQLELSEAQLKTKTGVVTLEEGRNSLISRLWLCENAKKTINVQYYSIAKDNAGFIMCDYLIRAADRGVKVRILLDALARKMAIREIQALDSHENIEVKVYNPIVQKGKRSYIRFIKTVRQINRIDQRMHNKVMVVDDVVAINGGRNIADIYFDYDEHYNFRDRDIMIFGHEVADVKKSFDQYWKDTLCVNYEFVTRKVKKKSNQKRFNQLHRYACNTKNFSGEMRNKVADFPNQFKSVHHSSEFLWADNVSFVADAPDKNGKREERIGSACSDTLMALLKQAKISIDIESPYLITMDEGKEMLRDAVKRGVKVRILTNSLCSTDNENAFSGYRRDRNETLETGIDIYEFKPNASVREKLMSPEGIAALGRKSVYGFHPKTMVIDHKISVVGSYNFDPRSANLNTECVMIVRSAEFAKVLQKHIDPEFLPENSWQTTKDFNPDSEAGMRKKWKAGSRRIFPKNKL
ncbi:MAG: phospholipase D family protein [Burkholderiales bacterium]|nr:phospholipase D family protein [Bacteroidia bacterium]